MLRVLIADDHPVLRKGLQEILIHEIHDVQCGDAKNAQETLDAVKGSSWDLVILDISMPGRSGLDILNEIKQERPNLPVLVLSIHPEVQYGRRALLAGASGYVNKQSLPDELIRAVRRVLSGHRYVSQSMAESLAEQLKEDSGRPLHESLSNREFQILRMIGSGKSNKQIAWELHLSPTTISTYRSRIFVKMNMKTTSDLIHYALSNNLID